MKEKPTKHYEVRLKELNNMGRPFLDRWVKVFATTRKEAREIAQAGASATQLATTVREVQL